MAKGLIRQQHVSSGAKLNVSGAKKMRGKIEAKESVCVVTMHGIVSTKTESSPRTSAGWCIIAALECLLAGWSENNAVFDKDRWINWTRARSAYQS